jgi:hypothetical protein
MVAPTAKKLFSVTLRVWRQAGPAAPGKFVDYPAANVSPDMSFLELLDVVNDEITVKGEEPRGHLRHLFLHDQRQAPRPGQGHRHLSALHAQLPGG